jgi:hypothetical protein
MGFFLKCLNTFKIQTKFKQSLVHKVIPFEIIFHLAKFEILWRERSASFVFYNLGAV